MKSILLLILLGFSLVTTSAQRYSRTIIVGAEQTEQYVPSLRGKKIAMLVNQTSRIGKVHLVDTLQRTSINIVRIFAPEHGSPSLQLQNRNDANLDGDHKTNSNSHCLYLRIVPDLY